MWSSIGSFVGGLVGAAFTAMWNRFFPPKTAADQKVIDLKESAQEAQNATKNSEQVGKENSAQLNDDLSKWVRDPNS